MLKKSVQWVKWWWITNGNGIQCCLKTHDIKDMGSNRFTQVTQVTTPRPRVKESTKSSWELVLS